MISTRLFLKSAGYGLSYGLLITTVLAASAQAAPSKRAPTPRDVQVDTVKEAYWNRTSEGDIEVVQNRQYSKKNRLSIGASIGTASTDPFLSVQAASASLGYHFSETFGVTAIYRKYLVSDSKAYDEFRSGVSTNVAAGTAVINTNRPSSFMGGEMEYSPLYGKISLSGASIVHYDAHLLLGAGITDTETGKYFTPTVGVGPQFYLGNSVAVRLDYRLAMMKETLKDKSATGNGRIAGERTNFSHQVNLGLVLFL